MKYSVLILILLIFIIALILVLLHDYYFYNMETMYIDSVYNIAETGDIIYFRWNTVGIPHECISPFTHIGIVLVDPFTKYKYIVETHLNGDARRLGILDGGIHRHNLKERIVSYNGYTFLSKLNNVHKPSTGNILKFISNFDKYKKEIPFHNGYYKYYKNNYILYKLCKNYFTIEDKYGLSCSEFAGFCLKELGIVEDDFDYICTMPIEFSRLTSNNKKIYQKIIKIKTN